MLKCFEMCRETSLFLGEGTLSDYAVADLSEIVTVDDHTLWTTVDVLDALSCTMREQDETSSSQTHDSPETQTSDPHTNTTSSSPKHPILHKTSHKHPILLPPKTHKIRSQNS